MLPFKSIIVSIEKLKEKREQQRQEAIRNAPDPECPPGHVLVNNEERKTTLAKLKESKLNQN